MNDFIKKNKEEGIVWDKAEAYFIHLTEPRTLHLRLRIQQFCYKWEDDIKRCEDIQHDI